MPRLENLRKPAQILLHLVSASAAFLRDQLDTTEDEETFPFQLRLSPAADFPVANLTHGDVLTFNIETYEGTTMLLTFRSPESLLAIQPGRTLVLQGQVEAAGTEAVPTVTPEP